MTYIMYSSYTYIDYIFLRGGFEKWSDSIKFLYFRQSVLHKILASDVFDYGHFKSESRHRAKKIREVFIINKLSRAIFAVMENRVCFGRRFKM